MEVSSYLATNINDNKALNEETMIGCTSVKTKDKASVYVCVT